MDNISAAKSLTGALDFIKKNIPAIPVPAIPGMPEIPEPPKVDDIKDKANNMSELELKKIKKQKEEQEKYLMAMKLLSLSLFNSMKGLVEETAGNSKDAAMNMVNDIKGLAGAVKDQANGIKDQVGNIADSAVGKLQDLNNELGEKISELPPIPPLPSYNDIIKMGNELFTLVKTLMELMLIKLASDVLVIFDQMVGAYELAKENLSNMDPKKEAQMFAEKSKSAANTAAEQAKNLTEEQKANINAAADASKDKFNSMKDQTNETVGNSKEAAMGNINDIKNQMPSKSNNK